MARKVAEGLGESDIISIPKELDKEMITCDSDIVGIITPVYAMGAPRIVADFVKS